jgi:hypothetical protein
MSETNLIVVDETSMAHAQVIRGLLESQGIRVWLNQESAGTAIGINLLTTMGIVKLIVRQESVDRARELIDAYYSGELENGDEIDQG